MDRRTVATGDLAGASHRIVEQVGGEVDRVFSLDGLGRDAALDQAKDEACAKAISAGAATDSVQVMDIEEVPLAYLPSNATRIRVKAVGDLEMS